MAISAKIKIAGVATLAAAGVLAGGATASASDAGVYTTNGSGYAAWTESGDSLLVCDLSSDSYGVRGYIYTPKSGDPGNGTVIIKTSDPSNDGNCVSATKNVSETARLGLKVCNYKGASLVRCSYKIIPGRG